MTNKFFQTTVITGLILFVGVFALAQSTTGRLIVTIKDQTGEPIPGATVVLTPVDDTVGGSFYAVAGNNGEAIIENIPPGKYGLESFASDFAKNSFPISVSAGVARWVLVTLEVSDFENTSDEPMANPLASSTQVTTRYYDQTLPSEPTLRSLVDISPFVRSESLAGGTSIDGATEPDNTYFIDGHEVTNPARGVLNGNHNLPFSFVNEVRIKSTGDSADLQGSIGGIVNVVTRGGNDEWKGDFGFSFSPRGLNGAKRPVLVRFGSGTGQFEYFQPNKDKFTGIFPHASLGGPVFKEKLWFFGSYSPLIANTTRTIDYYNTSNPNRTITQSINYKQTLRQEFAFIRFDANPIKQIKANISFLWNPTIQDGGLPSLTEGLGGVPQAGNGINGVEFLATRGGRNNANMVNGSVTWTPSSRFYITARGGRNFLNEKLGSYGANDFTRYLCSSAGNPQNFPGSNCARGFSNVSNNSVNRLDSSERATAAVDGGVAIDLSGKHLLKGGYQFDQIRRRINNGYIDTGLIALYYGVPISNLIGLPETPGNIGSGFVQRFGVLGDDKGRNSAFYGQTASRFGDRLTVEAGVRFENETVPSFMNLDSIEFGWKDKIAPRIGIAVDPLGKGNTRIFAGYFRNFDRLKSNVTESIGTDIFARDYFELFPSRGVSYTSYTFSNILGGNPSLNEECPIANPSGYSVCRISFFPFITIPPFTPLPSFDPELKPTRQDVFQVGVEQRVIDGLWVSGRYVRKNLVNTIEDIGFFNPQGSEGYIVGNPGRGLACEITQMAGYPCPSGKRKYDAFEVSVDRRESNYFFNASYAWSRLVGDYSGLANSDESGRISPNITRAFDLPSAGFTASGDSDSGRLATDRPHVLKGYGGFSFNWEGNQTTNVSAFTTLQSGTPLTTIYNLYNITNSILFERGDLGRTEMFSETDLRASHQFVIKSGRDYRIEVFAVFLNLFDENNELSRQTSISSTNFTSTTLTSGGCTTCQNQAVVYTTLFNQGGIGQFVQNFLNAQGTSEAGRRSDYNLPDRFQTPRSVRFGVNVRF